MRKSHKLRNIFIIILVIIFVVLLALSIRYFINPTYENANSLSTTEIQEILDKRNSLTNLYAKFVRQVKSGGLPNNHISYNEFFIDNNLAQMVSTLQNGQKQIYQENKETSNIEWVSEPDKIIMKMTNPKMGAFAFITHYDLSNFSDYTVVEHLGNTLIDGRENVVVYLKKDNSSTKEIIYIDKDTGLISKHITKTLFKQITDTTYISSLENTDFFIDVDSVYPDYKKGIIPDNNSEK